jgi:RNA polymerase sigma factor (sigma-70 family)
MKKKSPNDLIDGTEVALPDEQSGSLADERNKLAAFVTRNERQIRAIARRKLSQRARSWTDSEDIVSSVYLRLDSYLQRGELKYEGMSDLWPLISVIAQRRAIDRSRLSANAARVLREESDCDRLLDRIESHDRLDVTEFMLRVLARIETSSDRQLMILMLRGVRSSVAGELLGLSVAATRTRWSRLRKRLASELRKELDP